MKKKLISRVSMVIFSISLFIGSSDDSLAQTAITDTIKKSFRLFEEDKPVEISLRFDLATYFRAKPKDEYLKTNITIYISKTDSINKDIKLRTRGIFRNQYCRFAPIELNFKKTGFAYSDLNSISKIKLVPQCSSSKQNEDWVFREYLTYKLFNVLTDTSFRVRLLTINYFDSEKKRKPIRQIGFFIEPVEMLLARTNSVQIKTHALNQKNIVPKIMDRFAIFNYMIGNYDWAVPGQHNVLVIKSLSFDTLGLAVAIPHDFDWTGLVNPDYAIPAVEVGTETVRDRIYTGICRSNEVFHKDLELFSKKKKEFYRIINEFPYIDQSSKNDMIRYLDGFFDQLEGREDRLIYAIKNSCKNF
jgi:hypothetical protein